MNSEFYVTFCASDSGRRLEELGSAGLSSSSPPSLSVRNLCLSLQSLDLRNIPWNVENNFTQNDKRLMTNSLQLILGKKSYQGQVCAN